MWPIAIEIAVALTIGSVVGFALAILAMMARKRDEIAMLNWKPDKIARAARATERPSNHPTHRRSDVASQESICSIADCNKPRIARDWCRMHYQRWRRHGSVELQRISVSEWRQIAVAPKYDIHPAGLIRNRTTNQILNSWTHKSGHRYVKLMVDDEGGSKSFQVHRLVLETFVGPAGQDHEARHLDGSPEHNCVHNLAWGTRLENISDLVRHTGKTPKGALTFEQAEEIRQRYKKRGDGRQLAAEYGVHEGVISRIIRGQTYRMTT